MRTPRPETRSPLPLLCLNTPTWYPPSWATSINNTGGRAFRESLAGRRFLGSSVRVLGAYYFLVLFNRLRT